MRIYGRILSFKKTHTSSDVVLSCGLCGVGGERDWGGVCGGKRSGITVFVALWRGDKPIPPE